MLCIVIFWRPRYWRLKPQIVSGLNEVIFTWLCFSVELDLT